MTDQIEKKTMHKPLSKEDEALYDRQIRLWGLEAQQKIKGGTVVVAGGFTGVAQELVKNLALKGVGSIKLASLDPLPGHHYKTQGMLFGHLAEGAACSNQELAQCILEGVASLNPTIGIENIGSLDGDVECLDIIEGCSMLVLVNVVRPEVAFALNSRCRAAGCAFLWILCSAYRSVLINDFGAAHQYREEIVRGEARQSIAREIGFLSLRDLWQRHYELMQSHCPPKRLATSRPLVASPEFLSIQKALDAQDLDSCQYTCGIGSVEIAPVNSIVGAIAAQETIKAITGRDMPLDNVVMFDGKTLGSTILSIQSDQKPCLDAVAGERK